MRCSPGSVALVAFGLDSASVIPSATIALDAVDPPASSRSLSSRGSAVLFALTMPTRPPRQKRFAVYWCTTSDSDEDWFVVADSARKACRFHEEAEGYDRGEAYAERIMGLPDEVRVEGGWRDGPKGKVYKDAGWPSDELLIACGAEIGKQPRSGLRDTMGVVCKDVFLRGRHFRAGDVVANMDRAHGLRTARLGVFKGGKSG